jgi:hypothetical protein
MRDALPGAGFATYPVYHLELAPCSPTLWSLAGGLSRMLI